MRSLQQSKTRTFKGEGQEGQGGLFTNEASEVAISFPPAVIEEADDSL
jgi:hypothetical protein